MRMFVWFKIAKNKKNHGAILEGRWYTGRKIRQFRLNWLWVLTAISKMAPWIFLFFAILNHINIPITDFEVRIRCYFFPSELPCTLRLILFLYTYHTYDSPKLARVAQRKKNINEFWLQNLLWECLCDSKLQKTKQNLEPYWR